MAELHRVASTDELRESGSRVITEVKGNEICVFNHHGEFYAVLNYCIHQAGPLCEGPLSGEMTIAEDGWNWDYVNEGKIITCPWHRWKFDITTGQCVDDDRYQVPTYKVHVEEEQVYIGI